MTTDRTALVTTQGLDHRMSEVVADPTSAFAVSQRAAFVPRPTGGADGQVLVKSGVDLVWASTTPAPYDGGVVA